MSIVDMYVTDLRGYKQKRSSFSKDDLKCIISVFNKL
jgi:hypothetical protein